MQERTRRTTPRLQSGEVLSLGGNYGLLVTTPFMDLFGDVNLSNNWGIYINDQTAAAILANANAPGAGGTFTATGPFENFHSAGATSVNVFEGRINFGTATNSSPSTGDLWWDATHLYFRHGSTSTDLLAGGGGGSMAIGGAIGSGAGTNQVLYDDGSVTLQEAANFNIDAGNPNVLAGGAYEYDGSPVMIAQIAQSNFFDGGSGNLTNTGSFNTGTGNGALSSLTTGGKNSAIGELAGWQITNGESNLLIGYFAGYGLYLDLKISV